MTTKPFWWPTMQVQTADGLRLKLGECCGRGGEGAVYRVTARREGPWVAKLFHHPPSGELEAKLANMIPMGTPLLRASCAWPTELLYEVKTRKCCGYLMPELREMQPLHHLYTPCHRLRYFPDSKWDFLLAVARNLCACLATLHEHGIVVGDINPNVVYVGRSSRVCLIDTDSFQISRPHGGAWPCRVFTAHFTPPELQGLPSGAPPVRTVGHDAFGLAVLLFHLLYMGRHPYSGQGIGDTDLPLEASIRKHHYAYAAKRKRGAPAAPKGSVGPQQIGPPSLAALFESAFAPSRAKQVLRPLPREWHGALQQVIAGLKVCALHPERHVFSGELSACPWCEAERESGIGYFSSTPLFVESLSRKIQELNQDVCGIVVPVAGGISPLPAPSLRSPQFWSLRRVVWRWRLRLWGGRALWVFLPLQGAPWVWLTPLAAAWIYPGELDFEEQLRQSWQSCAQMDQEIRQRRREIEAIERDIQWSCSRDALRKSLADLERKLATAPASQWPSLKQEADTLELRVREVTKKHAERLQVLRLAEGQIQQLNLQKEICQQDQKYMSAACRPSLLFGQFGIEAWQHDLFPFRD